MAGTSILVLIALARVFPMLSVLGIHISGTAVSYQAVALQLPYQFNNLVTLDIGVSPVPSGDRMAAAYFIGHVCGDAEIAHGVSEWYTAAVDMDDMMNSIVTQRGNDWEEVMKMARVIARTKQASQEVLERLREDNHALRLKNWSLRQELHARPLQQGIPK